MFLNKVNLTSKRSWIESSFSCWC